jgi:Fur family iron response transcriptional regulator
VGHHVSLATVYNTLHQFKRAGLLRELAINGSRANFDTNVSNHNHFFIETDGELHDIPSDTIRVDGVPKPPEGMTVSHIDVVVRLVPKKP